jgi:predicted metallopeptidase
MEMIQYYDAPDINKRIEDITDILKFDHVDLKNLHCIRSRDSKGKRTIARIHGLGRIWQEALDMEPTYIIEVIHEQFDYYPPAAQDRTLIHELMHIPQTAKGGFRHHKNHVTHEKIDTWYKRYRQRRKELGLDKV